MIYWTTYNFIGYSLMKMKLVPINAPLKTSIIVTSIILFFGFLVMLFAKAPGMMYVGLLVSLTLFSAVFADLFLIPILCRSILKKDYK